MKLTGEPEEVLPVVQARMQPFVPGARCELQDYGFRIGCGMLDQWGNIQSVILPRDAWNTDYIDQAGKRLAALVASGGSTAG
jgi:hypothetical protein